MSSGGWDQMDYGSRTTRAFVRGDVIIVYWPDGHSSSETVVLKNDSYGYGHAYVEFMHHGVTALAPILGLSVELLIA